jgi:hypothetical protein
MKYIEFRKKLKRIGLNVKEFMLINNTNPVSAGNWRNKGTTPNWVPNFIQLLELLPLEQREKFFQEKLEKKNGSS